MRQRDRFQCLIEFEHVCPTLIALEKRLAAVPCLHKRVKVPRSEAVRLLVAKRDFDFAFRVFTEFTASEHALQIDKMRAAQAEGTVH